MNINFNNSIVIITGGASGIGKSISDNFYQMGATVLVLDYDDDKVKYINSLSDNKFKAYFVDITDILQVKSAINTIHNEYSKIDILVNNAGLNIIDKFENVNENDFNKVLDTNLKGTYFCTQEVVKYMIRKKSGKIINISSQAGITGQPYMTTYCSAKFAIIGLTQALALELGKYNITVNAICPGDVKDTDMHEITSNKLTNILNISKKELVNNSVNKCPLNRLQIPQDVSNSVLYIASEYANFITGESLNVSGGLEFH
mgnify:CR=1 FL=1|tara:strand:- start:458 stop:1234 length:777 start_codon:yes stop_codon:yes gene_type:complete